MFLSITENKYDIVPAFRKVTPKQRRQSNVIPKTRDLTGFSKWGEKGGKPEKCIYDLSF